MGNASKSLFNLKNNGVSISTKFKVFLTLLIGVTLAVIIPFVVNDRYISSLSQRLETVAVMFDSSQVLDARDHAKGSDSDYAFLKQKLSAAKAINGDARFLYIMGQHKSGDMYFVVDSEQPGSEGYSPRDEAYPDATPALKNIFATSRPIVEGPVKDSFGNWLSVLAPISDPSSQRPIAVVGMDIPASTYYTNIILSIMLPLLAALLVATIFITTDRIRKRRQESIQMRSELVSIASHELRTPLTGIRWGEETLMTADLTDKYRETVDTMYDSTLRLQESIEDILQLANVQAGRAQELMHVSTNITSMIEGIFATQKLPAAQKGIKMEFSTRWPHELVITCDAQRMKRVFNNLISNALKYSLPNTSVVVDYEKVDGKHLISIADHGIGIPESEQTKVFAGFYRATNAVEHEAGGTGMGLYLSRSVIEQHGGKLWLISKQGSGTTVYIQLP